MIEVLAKHWINEIRKTSPPLKQHKNWALYRYWQVTSPRSDHEAVRVNVALNWIKPMWQKSYGLLKNTQWRYLSPDIYQSFLSSRNLKKRYEASSNASWNDYCVCAPLMRTAKGFSNLSKVSSTYAASLQCSSLIWSPLPFKNPDCTLSALIWNWWYSLG